MTRRFLLLFAAAVLIGACEKIDLEEDNPSANTEDNYIVPKKTGKGTQNAPFTPEQFLKEESLTGGTCWIVGYAVGSTYRTMNNAVFSATGAYTANLLLAEDSLCIDVSQCIPIELTSSVQSTLSLGSHPECFHRCILVEGAIGRYFSQRGLRNVKSGYWLPASFNLRDIDISPTDWEERDETF